MQVAARVTTRVVTRVALVVAAGACFHNVGPAVTSVAAHAPGRVVITLDEEPLTALYGLRVATCGGGRTMWEFGRTDGPQPSPDSVVYGDVPPGFLERVAARALTPGCYEVSTSGPAVVRFDVRGDGTAALRPALPRRAARRATRSKTAASRTGQPSSYALAPRIPVWRRS
jgi:hypothetical protein